MPAQETKLQALVAIREDLELLENTSFVRSLDTDIVSLAITKTLERLYKYSHDFDLELGYFIDCLLSALDEVEYASRVAQHYAYALDRFEEDYPELF